MRIVKIFYLILTFLGIGLFISAFFPGEYTVQDEIDRINREIKLMGLRWEAGETNMSRLTTEERRRRLGAYVPQFEQPEMYAAIEPRAELPNSFDWRSYKGKNYLTTVKNQADCGSCWAFAAAGIVEAMYNIENGLYSTKIEPPSWTDDAGIQKNIRIQSRRYPDLSEQDLVSCSTAGDCDGGYSSLALKCIKNDGVVIEDCFPYTAKDDPCILCNNWKKKLVKVNSWGWVTQNTVNKKKIKTAIQGGPVAMWMEVYSDFYNYKKGVYEPTPGATYEGGHIVVCVGYNESQDYWLCKNSWGGGFGEGGYFKIKMGACGTGHWVLKTKGVILKNKPPVFGAVPAQSVKEGQELVINLKVMDPDEDRITYEAEWLPKGAFVGRNSGKFEWTPDHTQAGEYFITFLVTDGVFERSRTCKITVINVKKGKGMI